MRKMLRPSTREIFKEENVEAIHVEAKRLMAEDPPAPELVNIDPKLSVDERKTLSNRLKMYRANKYRVAISHLVAQAKQSGSWEELEERVEEAADGDDALPPHVQHLNREKNKDLFREFADHAFRTMGIRLVTAYAYQDLDHPETTVVNL
jgi:hypothetical protein